MNVDGKTILVTGAGKGIGRTIALRLADEGARVVATGHALDNARRTRDEIRDRNGDAIAHGMDVTSAEEIRQIVDAVTDGGDRIDGLVNNAGVSTMNPFLDLSEEEWDRNMDVNAKGVFLCSQIVGRQMVESAGDDRDGISGKIINIASKAARTGVPLLAHYAASKWAVLGLTQSMALELAEHDITVNAVCPGYVKTGMQERELEWEAELTDRTPEEVRRAYVDDTPLGRLQTPDDVADLVVFLASDLSDFITGQAINTCGGSRMD